MDEWDFNSIRLIERLGAGGGGTTWRAERVGPDGFDVQMALVVKFPNVHEPDKRRRNCNSLRDEVSCLSRLRHGNVIRLLHWGFAPHPDEAHQAGAQPVPYAVLEYGGVPLSRLIRGGVRLEPAIAAYVALQMAAGLAHAHRRGIIHRDIKPPNVLVDEEGTIRLIDLGIAKADNRVQTTQQGLIKGTPEYFAPEQIACENIDARSDQFSLGVLLWELLTGRPVWKHPKQAPEMIWANAVMKAIQSEPTPRLEDQVRYVPQGLAAVLYRLLQKKPEDRFANMDEVWDVLAPFALASGVLRRELGRQAFADMTRSAAPQPAGEELVSFDVGSSKAALSGSTFWSTDDSLVSIRPAPNATSAETSGDSESAQYARSRSSAQYSWEHPDAAAEAGRALVPRVVRNTPSPSTEQHVITQDIQRPLAPVPTRPRRKVVAWAAATLGLIGTGVIVATTFSGDFDRTSQGANASSKNGAPTEPKRNPPMAPGPTDTSGTGTSDWVNAPVTQTAPATVAAAAAPSAPTSSGTRRSRNGRNDSKADRDATSPEGLASLRVAVLPRGAFVSIDNQPAIPAPAEFQELTPGTHTVRAGEERARLTKEQKVDLAPGQNLKIQIFLSNPFAK